MMSSLKFQLPENIKKTDYNVLLIGGVGQGKSTLINSFANYLHYKTKREAMASTIKVVIPYNFHKENIGRGVNIGQDENETLNTDDQGKRSQTQSCRSYVFSFPEVRLRIIDTPGINRMMDREGEESVENIMEYLQQFDHLHAFGLVMKSTENSMTPEMIHILKLIFQNFEKTVVENVVVFFTFGEECSFNPEKAIEALKTSFGELKVPKLIHLIDKRQFCFENKGLKSLYERESSINNFEDADDESWDLSFNEFSRFMKFIFGGKKEELIVPHELQSTQKLYEIKKIVKVQNAICKSIERKPAIERCQSIINTINNADIIHSCSQCLMKVVIKGKNYNIPRYCSKLGWFGCRNCHCTNGVHTEPTKDIWTKQMDECKEIVTEIKNELALAQSFSFDNFTKAFTTNMQKSINKHKPKFIKYINENALLQSEETAATTVKTISPNDITLRKNDFYEMNALNMHIKLIVEAKANKFSHANDTELKFQQSECLFDF